MVHVMHMLMFFTVFKNLKSSFSEGIMPIHAIDFVIKTYQNGLNYPIKHKK